MVNFLNLKMHHKSIVPGKIYGFSHNVGSESMEKQSVDEKVVLFDRKSFVTGDV